ncbi:Vacuolar protein sorting-associated protein 62, partial [Serendipita sp. 399]
MSTPQVIEQVDALASAAHAHPHNHDIDELPAFALKYAPLVYLHSDEKYFPGKPEVHIKGLVPCTLLGDKIEVPEEHRGKLSMLGLKEVNRPEVFLTLEKNIRSKGGDLIEELRSSECKPCSAANSGGHEGSDLTPNGKSEAPVWILVRDKTGPYNQGNTVLFTHFGNHIGDWEHAMIRFRNGKPEAMHLSAHSDGNAWKWDAFEKKGDRPVIYAAIGSHANYPNPGTHAYSGVFLVGPTDSTNTGHLWDPVLNFVCAKSVLPSPDDPHPCSKYAYIPSSAPGFNQSYSPDDVVTVLTFEGRWGNSFSDLRARAKGKSARDRAGASAHAAEASSSSSSSGESESVGADKTSAGSR